MVVFCFVLELVTPELKIYPSSGTSYNDVTISWLPTIQQPLVDFSKVMLIITIPAFQNLDEIVRNQDFASSSSASWSQVINLSRFQFGNHKFKYMVQSGSTNSQFREIQYFRG